MPAYDEVVKLCRQVSKYANNEDTSAKRDAPPEIGPFKSKTRPIRMKIEGKANRNDSPKQLPYGEGEHATSEKGSSQHSTGRQKLRGDSMKGHIPETN
jgi:hypothetical protein